MATTRLPLRGSHSAASASAREAAGRVELDALYRLHFGGLFDFAVRIVGTPDAAASVVRRTLATAWDPIRLGRCVNHPQAWVFAIARGQAIDELRRRSYAAHAPAGQSPDIARAASVHADAQLATRVWRAARLLSPDDYSLLDMHVRRGLGAAQLAHELELERGTMYTRLSRLRNSLEEPVAAALLAARGSADCAELGEIVARHVPGDALDPALRRAIRGHVRGCETCSAARRRIDARVLAVFAELLPVPAAAGVQEAIWDDVMGAAARPEPTPPRAPAPAGDMAERAAMAAQLVSAQAAVQPRAPRPRRRSASEPRTTPRSADGRLIAAAAIAAAGIAVLVALGSGSGSARDRAQSAPRHVTAPSAERARRSSGASAARAARKHRRRHNRTTSAAAAPAAATTPPTATGSNSTPPRAHHRSHKRSGSGRPAPAHPNHTQTAPHTQPHTTPPHTHTTPPANTTTGPASPPAQTAPTGPAPPSPAPANGGTTVPAAP